MVGEGAADPYPRGRMSETELSVVCKNCGSEVSPYVTECPYCGARIRKRAPKLERRGDGLEAKLDRKQRRSRARQARQRLAADRDERPWATIAVAAVSSVMLLVLVASGDDFDSFGGYISGIADQPWRYLTSPFTYVDVGYWFVVVLALAIYGPGLERRLGMVATLVLMVACGALGTLGAAAVEGDFTVITGGNGIALGVLAAWFLLRRAEGTDPDSGDEGFDGIGVAVSAIVLLVLPVFDNSANVFAGVAGGLIGMAAALAALTLRRPAR